MMNVRVQLLYLKEPTQKVNQDGNFKEITVDFAQPVISCWIHVLPILGNTQKYVWLMIGYDNYIISHCKNHILFLGKKA